MPNLLHRVVHLEQLVFGDVHEGGTSLRIRRSTIITGVGKANPYPADPSNERRSIFIPGVFIL
jgi:hypothetical protein